MPLTTDLDIVNAACALLSVEPLQSLDAETPGGQSVALLYDPVVELCLGLAPWSFARKPVALNKVTGVTSKLGYSYIHQLPAARIGLPDRLIHDIAVPNATVQAFDYDEEDRVHSDHDPLWAQVTVKVAPSRWHPVFRTAVIHAVAAVLAEPLTGNSAMAADMNQKAFGTPSESWRGGLMRAALNADGRNTPARSLPATNPLLNAWMSG